MRIRYHHRGSSFYEVDNSICEAQRAGSLDGAGHVLDACTRLRCEFMNGRKVIRLTGLPIWSVILIEKLAGEVREGSDYSLPGELLGARILGRYGSQQT